MAERKTKYTNADLVQRTPMSVTTYNMDTARPSSTRTKSKDELLLDQMLAEGMSVEDILWDAQNTLAQGEKLGGREYLNAQADSDTARQRTDATPHTPAYKAVTSPLRGAALAGSFIPGINVPSAAMGALLAGGEAMYEGRPLDAGLEAGFALAPVGLSKLRGLKGAKGPVVDRYLPNLPARVTRGKKVQTSTGANRVGYADPTEYRDPRIDPYMANSPSSPAVDALIGEAPGDASTFRRVSRQQRLDNMADEQAGAYRQRRGKGTAGFNVPSAGSDLDRMAAAISRILGE